MSAQHESPDEAPPRFTVKLFTEASPQRGFGHLVRCVALYDALEVCGASPTLVVRGDAVEAIVEGRSAIEVEWAMEQVAQAVARGIDAAVIDSYEAEADVYHAVAHEVSAAAYLDDTQRLDYPPGIVVNGSPAAGSEGPGRLFGPRYQPLRRLWWGEAGRSAPTGPVRRALVIFGGTDAAGLRERVVPGLIAAFPEIAFDVVREARPVAEVWSSMLAADVAITAAGQTLYELARTATPIVAVCAADNQREQAAGFAAAGAAIVAGDFADPDITERITRGLRSVQPLEARQTMSAAGAALVDGQGALRVARALLARALAARVVLRAAGANDEAALLRLANDPVARANSLHTGEITAEEHHSWFQARISHPDECLLLLAWDGPDLAGQVRFDRTGGSVVTSIAVAEQYRGLGWSSMLLASALAELGSAMPGVLCALAVVRSDNHPSRRIFEQLGFRLANRCESSETVEYRRSLTGVEC